jgi:thiol-disulfide isomerase/thioredoxin
MKERKKPSARFTIVILIAIIGLIAVIITLDGRAERQPTHAGAAASADLTVGTSTGNLAPDFEGLTLEGESLRLSDLRGKVVVLNLFASWCGPCRLEMPHLVEAYQGLEDGKAVFVGLNLNEKPEVVAAFRNEFGIPFPLVLDQGGELTGNIYRPIGLPTTWFIDREGVVRYVYSGAMIQEILERILADVKAGREPNPFAQSG